MFDEPLTPDQIDRLESVRRESEGNAGLASEDLEDISRREQPIYVTVNRHHNLVVVRTADSRAIGSIEELVDELDRPTPQVLLEMKILELAVGNSFRAAFDFEYSDGARSQGPDSGQAANPLLPSAVNATEDVVGVGNFPLEGSTFVYQFLNDRIRARIQLLETENELEVIATPMLLASNNSAARVFIGEERVLTTGVDTDIVTPATGATSTAVSPQTEIRDIGTSLIIFPRINSDGTVTLLISQDSSTVQPNSTTIPVASADGGVREFPIDSINTANLQGTVVAKDGFSVAVGGLIRTTVSESAQKVPLLGDIPILGRLFRRDIKDRAKTELVLIITPKILKLPGEEGDKASKELLERVSKHPFHTQGEGALDRHFPEYNRDEPKDE